MPPPSVNNYTLPKVAPYPDPENILASPEPYDINSSFPVHLDTLACPTVRSCLRCTPAHSGSRSAHRHASDSSTTHTALPHFLSVLEGHRQNPHTSVFAIFDWTREPDGAPSDSDAGERDGVFAGTLALINTSKPHKHTEIGLVIVLPAWAGLPPRPLVGPSAKRAVDQAREAHGIQGGGRVALDIRFILTREAPVVEREGDEGWGRHTASLAICWDEWDSHLMVGERLWRICCSQHRAADTWGLYHRKTPSSVFV